VEGREILMAEEKDEVWDEDSEYDDEPVYYLTDRTTATTDDKCGMRRWWYKHEGGQGIVPVAEAEALSVGKETHEDLAAIAAAEDISPAAIAEAIGELLKNAPSDLTQSSRERIYRRLGWIAAFALFIEPKIREEFETISIEAEHILDRDPLWVSYTPDRYLRHREGGYLVYREYKTAKMAGPKWMQSWPFAIQLHIGLAGMEEELGEKVAYGQIMGLMKGEVREGRLRHPYVWGWHNAKSGEWTHDYNKARSAQWEPMPVWEFPGGVVAWVQRCGEAVALGQFPHSAPVFLDRRLLEDWVVRRTQREETLVEVMEECRADWQKRIIYFEPRTEQCRPAYGDPCPYLLPCHNAAVRENPLACPDYTRRTPHHETEINYLAGEE
jgi:hypothetical protein